MDENELTWTGTQPVLKGNKRDLLLARLRPVAAQALLEHRQKATSTESVFEIYGEDNQCGIPSVRHIGDVEVYGHLVNNPGYFTVSDKDLTGAPQDDNRMVAVGHGLYGKFASRWEQSLDRVAARIDRRVR